MSFSSWGSSGSWLTGVSLCSSLVQDLCALIHMEKRYGRAMCILCACPGRCSNSVISIPALAYFATKTYSIENFCFGQEDNIVLRSWNTWELQLSLLSPLLGFVLEAWYKPCLQVNNSQSIIYTSELNVRADGVWDFWRYIPLSFPIFYPLFSISLLVFSRCKSSVNHIHQIVVSAYAFGRKLFQDTKLSNLPQEGSKDYISDYYIFAWLQPVTINTSLIKYNKLILKGK